MSVPLVSTGKTVDLVKFLSEQLQPLMTTVATYRVTEYFNPPTMIKLFLENGSFNVVVSVRHGSSSTSREYNGVPNTENVPFYVEVWMLDDPAYTVKAGIVPKSEVRDRFVEDIKKALKKYPVYGTCKGDKTADYSKHNQHVLCTIITVAQLIE